MFPAALACSFNQASTQLAVVYSDRSIILWGWGIKEPNKVQIMAMHAETTYCDCLFHHHFVLSILAWKVWANRASTVKTCSWQHSCEAKSMLPCNLELAALVAQQNMIVGHWSSIRAKLFFPDVGPAHHADLPTTTWQLYSYLGAVRLHHLLQATQVAKLSAHGGDINDVAALPFLPAAARTILGLPPGSSSSSSLCLTVGSDGMLRLWNLATSGGSGQMADRSLAGKKACH